MIKKINLAGLFSILFALSITAQAQDNSNSTIDNIATTTVDWHSPIFWFGDIQDGEKIRNVFTFTNTGSEPLVISNAKGSCGCTVPMWPKEPIAPGETAELLVQFDSKNKGKEYGYMQSKRISITTNTNPEVSYLTIRGKVFKPASEKSKSKKNRNDYINLTFSKEELDVASSDVSLYPNPTIGELKINIKDHDNISGSIEIYGGTGIRIERREIEDFGTEQLFDVLDYKPGVYTASINITGKNRIAKRFIVPES